MYSSIHWHRFTASIPRLALCLSFLSNKDYSAVNARYVLRKTVWSVCKHDHPLLNTF